MRRLLTGSLAASAAIAAMLVGSATAASATHSVQLDGTASLVGKGAAVTVPVTVTCAPSPYPGPFPSPFPPPFPGSSRVAVQVTERSGNRIAQGYGSASAVCDGTPHTVDVQVTAQGAPFKHGDAVATATMTVCDYFYGCHNATDTETIQVGK